MTVSRSTFVRLSGGGLAIAGLPRAAVAQSSPLSVRVAATANDANASAYYAQDMGFFTRAGLAVDLQTLKNGATVTSALSGGAIDIGITTPVAAGAAYLQGLPITAIAAAGLSLATVPSLLLCVAKNSPIKNARDLEGQTIALISLRTGSELSIDAWFAQNGADVTKAKLLEMPPPSMGPAIERGVVAAALLTEPALTMARKENNVQELADLDGVLAPRLMNSLWCSMRDFAVKNPEVVHRFQRAIYAAQAWANGHQSDSAVILAKYADMDLNIVRSMTRVPWAVDMRLTDIQPFLDAATKYGILPRPLAASTLVYRA